MKKKLVETYITSDGVTHHTHEAAVEHATMRYKAALLTTARPLISAASFEMEHIIECNLDSFVALRDLKNDIDTIE